MFLYLQTSEGKAAEVPKLSLRRAFRARVGGLTWQQEHRAEPGTVLGAWDRPGAWLPAQFIAPRPQQWPEPHPPAPQRPSPLGTRVQEWLGGKACPLGVPVVLNQ